MEKNFQVNLNDQDLYKAVEDLINHKNKKEIAVLLSNMLLDNTEGCDWLFKLILGGKLPEILPVNTLCYVDINKLNYQVDKPKLKASKLNNGNDQIICTIENFLGFHRSYYTYDIKHKYINDSGDVADITTSISYKYLTPIEEF